MSNTIIPNTRGFQALYVNASGDGYVALDCIVGWTVCGPEWPAEPITPWAPVGAGKIAGYVTPEGYCIIPGQEPYSSIAFASEALKASREASGA